MTLRQVDRLSVRELGRWARYWNEEPWGPLRDNMHAAAIAMEVARPYLKEGAKLSMSRFMYTPVEDRKKQAQVSFVAQLEAMARRDAKRLKP